MQTTISGLLLSFHTVKFEQTSTPFLFNAQILLKLGCHSQVQKRSIATIYRWTINSHSVANLKDQEKHQHINNLTPAIGNLSVQTQQITQYSLFSLFLLLNFTLEIRQTFPSMVTYLFSGTLYRLLFILFTYYFIPTLHLTIVQ